MKEKIKNLIELFYTKYVNNLKMDNVLHAYVSTFICVILFSIFNLFIPLFWLSLLCAFVVTHTIGYCKEKIIDEYIRKGKFELKDIISNLVGNSLGVIIILIMKLTFS